MRIAGNLNIAVIGLGTQSLSDHIPALLKRGDLNLTCVCDPLTVSQNKFKRAFPKQKDQTKIYSSFHQMFSTNDIDFAIVAIPHHQYLEIAKYLCARKIPFMKEKPLARDLQEAVDLFRIPNFNKYAFICTQRRYNKLYKKAYETIPSLGNIYLFNAVYKLSIPNPHEGWRGQTEYAGGGCILDMGYHIVDQLVWWFGLPDEISAHKSTLAVPGAEYDAEDSATVSFKYNNGLHGSLLLSRSAGDKQEDYALYGSEGLIQGNKKHLIIKDKEGSVLHEEKLEDTFCMIDEQLDFFIKRLRSGEGFIDIQDQNLMNMRFIDRCYNRVTAKTKPEHALLGE